MTTRKVAMAALIGLISCGLLAASDGLTPHQLAGMRSVTSAKISPDGLHIAYLLSVPRPIGVGKNGTAWSELHLISVQDRRSRPFVTGEVNVSSIGWTPDGKAISFLAKRNGDEHTSLYAIPIDGGEARRVAELKSAVQSYSWSPDGRRVALIATEPSDEDLEKLKKEGFDQEIYEEDWRQRKVYIAKAFSGEKEAKALDLPGAAFQVHWSPAADRLAVALASTPLVDDRYMTQKIHLVDASTGEVKARLDNEGKLGRFTWSPDGRHLAMVGSEDINDPGAGRLQIGSVEGGSVKDILDSHQGHVSSISWPQTDRLFYLNDEGVETYFERIAPGGGDHRRILANGPSLTSTSLSKDGQHAAMVASTPEHPSEVFVMRHGDSGPQRLTDSNPWLAEVRLAKQELVKFKARDGLELEGLLIRPLDEEPGKRYPLVMNVHGGPESHHSNGWLTTYSNPGQLLAARGIAAFYTNYRGSTGRGVAFSKLSQADPAGKEFDDLVDAVDHLIASGLIDKDKVGVTGGSYGGYATAWCSTYYSDRFAAGVMFVGISNKISKVGTTDIANEEYHVHARKRPWDDWQFFLDRSPLYHAAKGRTPLLILHGKADPRVNVGQSRELYRHLKLQGKAPVRLVLYPGEGHGNRRAAGRLDYNLRALRWLEHYLKGPGGDPPSWRVNYDDPSKKKEVNP